MGPSIIFREFGVTLSPHCQKARATSNGGIVITGQRVNWEGNSHIPGDIRAVTHEIHADGSSKKVEEPLRNQERTGSNGQPQQFSSSIYQAAHIIFPPSLDPAKVKAAHAWLVSIGCGE